MSEKETKLPLSQTHPDLSEEAHGWDPGKFTAGSSQKVNWICSLNHEWTTKIVYRTKFKNQCPYCTNKKLLKGFNDLQTLFPKISQEAFGWDPSTVLSKIASIMSWKCNLGHVWDASINNRTFNQNSCPYCSNRKILIGFNDLASTHPKIAAEACGWDSMSTHAGNTQSREWICASGHVWKASAKARTESENSRNHCQKCSPFKKQRSIYTLGRNDLLSNAPTIAAQAKGWDPSIVQAGSGKKMEWICDKGHVWEATPSSRTHRKYKKSSGCPTCGNRQIVIGFNDLASTHPKIAVEACGWDPTSVVSGAEKKMLWKCHLGHEWINSPFNRTRGQESPCPFCSGRKVWAGFNDLETTHPEIAKDAHGWNPIEYSANQRIRLSWKCQINHEWKVSLYSRTHQCTNCPYCANKLLLTGFNDLRTKVPQVAAEAFNWDPATVLAGSTVKKTWKCAEGHIWRARVSSRSINFESRLGAGCPSCSRTGFDPNKPAWIYFGVHESLELLQIGITNKLEQRLKIHARFDWNIQDIYGPIDGLLAQEWETSILKMLREKGATMGPRKDKIYRSELKKQDSKSVGTEIWTTSTFSVNSIKELMQLTEEFEENKKIKNKNE